MEEVGYRDAPKLIYVNHDAIVTDRRTTGTDALRASKVGGNF